jgi:hypothetical protein
MTRPAALVAKEPPRNPPIAEYVTKVLLWLVVINLGIVFGAGLYEARIEFPKWLVIHLIPAIAGTPKLHG